MYYAVFIVTFILFFIEALLHFNVGCRSNDDKCESRKSINLGFHLYMPDKQELIEIITILTIFSTLNSFILGSQYFSQIQVK